jgi:transcriptional regulator with XRE-family HTH domain
LETGVHRNYIGGIERGERSPSVEAIVKLAEALDVTLSDLFRRAERLAAG